MENENNYFEGMLNNEYLKYLNERISSSQNLNYTQNHKLGISEKYERNLYEDKNKMYKYRDNLYQDKKTIKDPITKQLLHKDQEAAKNKYKSNYREHIPQVDHVMSLSENHERLKKNPYLSDNDLKEILNQDYNFSVVNAKFNNMKSDDSPFKVIFDKDNGLNLEERIRFAQITSKAKIGVTNKIMEKTTKNVAAEFVNGSVDSIYKARTAIMIQGIYNLQQVYSNEKTMEEALVEMGKLSAFTVASGGAKKVVETGFKNILNNLQKNVLKIQNISKSKIGKIIELTKIVGASAVKLMNGEIDGKEFFIEIGEKGVESIGAIVGAIAGELLIPIPFVGSIIGSIIVANTCSFVYRHFIEIGSFMINNIDKLKQKYREFKDIGMLNKKLSEINLIVNEAIIEMNRQRDVLKANIEKYFKNWDIKVNSGLEIIFKSTMDNDVEGIAKGLDEILEIFDGKVKFKSFEKFDEFFMNDNSILEL